MITFPNLPPLSTRDVTYNARALDMAKDDTNTCRKLALPRRLFHTQESKEC